MSQDIVPRYKHDCEVCEFQGTFFGDDIYICGIRRDGMGPSIIARHSDDPPDYDSTPIRLFRREIEQNETMGVGDLTMPFRDYLFSEHVTRCHKAWLLVLTLRNFHDAQQDQ